MVLALGDAMAALIGRRYGKHKIYGKKSLEGLIAFIITTCAAIYIWGLAFNIEFILSASVLCGLIEVFSGDVDNIALPLGFILIHTIYN